MCVGLPAGTGALASPPGFWPPVPLADPVPSAGGADADEGDDEELEDEEEKVDGDDADGGVVEGAPPTPVSLASPASDGSRAAAG